MAPLKIAILQKDTKSEGHEDALMGSFFSAIHDVAADAQVSVFDPIELQAYTDLNGNFDAIILSGGTTEHDSTIPWVAKMQRFIRDTVTTHPNQPLIGFCWGHQAIHKSLGGVVERIPEGPEVSSRLQLKGKAYHS
jgi:glucosinolate gamma-glutamyl hydrolase